MADASDMRIGDRHIGDRHEPYVIAEIGVNHDGSAQRAMELVDFARQAGADAVKLQFFEAHRLLSGASRLAEYQKRAGAGDPHEMLRRLELPIEALRRIAGCAAESGLHPIVTVFSDEMVEAALSVEWAAFKTASSDIINRPLLDALAATGRPMLISTGAATLNELRQAVQWLGDHCFALLQCVTAYPTPDESAHLAGMRALQAVASVPVGYSDHTTSVDTGALAVAAGACILEKHITYDRKANGPDHAMSLEPAQFERYVRLARRAHAMLGRSSKQVIPIEQEVRQASRQSIVATRTLKSGHVIARPDLTIKRPGTGIEPWRIDEVVGRRLRGTVEADSPIVESDLEAVSINDAEAVAPLGTLTSREGS